MTQKEMHPSEYYQTPTMLTSEDYVEKLLELQKRGDNVPGILDVLALFKDLRSGHERAWDVMHSIPHEHAETYRDWLAWRVVSEAIQYFSRLWRDDASFLQYYEEYRKFVDEGVRSHKRWTMCDKKLGGE